MKTTTYKLLLTITLFLILITPCIAESTNDMNKFSNIELENYFMFLEYKDSIQKDSNYINKADFGKANFMHFLELQGISITQIQTNISFKNDTIHAQSKHYPLHNLQIMESYGFSDFTITEDGELHVGSYLAEPFDEQLTVKPHPYLLNQVQITSKTPYKFTAFEGGTFYNKQDIEYLPFEIEFRGTINYPLEEQWPEKGEPFALYLDFGAHTTANLYVEGRKRASYELEDCETMKTTLIIAPIKDLFNPSTLEQRFGPATAELQAKFPRGTITPGATLGTDFTMYDAIRAYHAGVSDSANQAEALDANTLGAKLFFLQHGNNTFYKPGLKHPRFLFRTTQLTEQTTDVYELWLDDILISYMTPKYIIGDDGKAYNFFLNQIYPNRNVILTDLNVGHYGQELELFPDASSYCIANTQLYGSQTRSEEQIQEYLGEENMNLLLGNVETTIKTLTQEELLLDPNQIFGAHNEHITTDGIIDIGFGKISKCAPTCTQIITSYMGNYVRKIT